jgi:adenylate kinase
MPTYIVLLGAPGAGKGTQGERLKTEFGFARVATGDLFRDHIGRGTQLGLQVKPYLESGKLVPDELTIAMLRARIQEDDCRKGVILDGFPRTLPQAMALDALLEEMGTALALVPHIAVTRDELLRRLSGRWMCRAADHVYHAVFNPPKQAGVCDIDGSPLYQRVDDTREVQERRIDVYMQHTAPLIDYYRDRGVLVAINGLRSIDEVYADLRAAVEKVLAA